MNTEEIAVAHDDFQGARRDLCNAAALEANLKFRLDAEEAAAILDKRIGGKNQEEREAMSAMIFSEARLAVHEAEQDRRAAQATFDIAESRVKCLELQLRLMEWTK